MIDGNFFTQRTDLTREFTNPNQLKMAESLTGMSERTRVDAHYYANVNAIEARADINTVHKLTLKAVNFFQWLFSTTQEFRDAARDDVAIQNASTQFKNATTDLIWSAYNRTFVKEEANRYGGQVLRKAKTADEADERIANREKFATASTEFHNRCEEAFNAYVASQISNGTPIAEDQMGPAKKEFMEVAMRLFKLEGNHSHFYKETDREGHTKRIRAGEANPSKRTIPLIEAKLRFTGAVFTQKVYTKELESFAQRFARPENIDLFTPVSLKKEVEALVQMTKGENEPVDQAQQRVLKDLCREIMLTGRDWTNNGMDWEAAAAALNDEQAINAAVEAQLRDRLAERDQKLRRFADLLAPSDLRNEDLQEFFAQVRDANGNPLNFDDLNSDQIRGFFKSEVQKAVVAVEGYVVNAGARHVEGNQNEVWIPGPNGGEVKVAGRLLEVEGRAAVDNDGNPIPNQVIIVNENGDEIQANGIVIRENRVRLHDQALVWGTALKLRFARNQHNQALRGMILEDDDLSDEELAARQAANPAQRIAQAELAWTQARQEHRTARQKVTALIAERQALPEQIRELENNMDAAETRNRLVAEREDRANFLRAFVAHDAEDLKEAALTVFEAVEGFVAAAVIPGAQQQAPQASSSDDEEDDNGDEIIVE